MSVELIDRAAIALGDDVFALPQPARHDNVLAMMVNVFGIKPPVKGVQGFLTTHRRFVTRKEAALLALRQGQVKQVKYHPFLHCEDIWL